MVNRTLPVVALIAGPTASGKSALALALAEARGGVIINADSAQLYRDLPILSAAPSPADRSRAEHRLYGIRDGAEPCSAAAWASLAKREIAGAHASDRLPILVGGTGLYLRTLFDGIAPVPSIDPAIRGAVRSASVSENHAALALLDPGAAARLNPGDSTRVARALEVVRSTGRTLAEWQKDISGGIGEAIAVQPLLLLPPRDWLVARCDLRFQTMAEDGALDEVERLLDRSLDPHLPDMRAIGVRELGAFIRGDTNLDQAIADGQRATRRYAKRQYTWFANQPPSHWRRWPTPLTDPAEALAQFGLAS